MKQINYNEAQRIADDAALRAMGFGPFEGTVTLDATEVQRVAVRAAMCALDAAGFLREQTARDNHRMSELASDARRREVSFKRR